MIPTILIKRIYEEPAKEDGFRILVDRLWPRGIKKEAAVIDEWLKDLAPSTALRQWFGHAPDLWADFQKKYKVELKQNPLVDSFLTQHAHTGIITLLYAAKDMQHNHALVLQQYLKHEYTQ